MRNRLLIVLSCVLSVSRASAQALSPAPVRSPSQSAAGATAASARGGAAAAAADDNALPTVEQLKEQLQQGKHQDVLRQVQKLLALKGEHAKGYDRYELFSLRGEAALRGKNNAVATESFAQAAKATEDPVDQAVARATEILIRRSKPIGYVPRTAQPAAASPQSPAAPAGAKLDGAPRGGAREPIPILEPEDRKRALAALFADELAGVEPKVKSAVKATGLLPVIEAIKPLGDLRAIEVAAHSSSEQTKTLAAQLGEHAHRLIDDAMRSMERRVEECWDSASRQRYAVDAAGTPTRRLYGMLGLTSVEQKDLKAAIETCKTVEPVASELAAVTGRPELLADAQTAQRLRARATEVLTFDYPNEGRFNRNPNRPGGR